MKLHEQFKVFLDEHLNLNAKRLGLLRGSIVAVEKSILALDWGLVFSFSSQGFWAHDCFRISVSRNALVPHRTNPGWPWREHYEKSPYPSSAKSQHTFA